jgi:hypothetical protein
MVVETAQVLGRTMVGEDTAGIQLQPSGVVAGRKEMLWAAW